MAAAGGSRPTGDGEGREAARRPGRRGDDGRGSGPPDPGPATPQAAAETGPDAVTAGGRFARWRVDTVGASMDPAARRRVLITVLIGVAATSFPFTVFGASLPLIADDLGTSESTITWVITAPILGYAMAIPVLGKLGDLRGHRRVYIWGFAAATLLAALTATAWSVGSLIALRTLGQMTGAATGPSSMAIIMTAFPKEERAKAVGWWSLVVAGSPTIGLAVGGPLIDAVGWRVLFVIQAVPAALAVVAAMAILPETRRKPDVSLDVLGAGTLGLGVGAGLFALNRGAAWGWDHPASLLGFALSPVVLALFVAVERRARNPLLPLAFFRRRNFTGPILANLFSQAAYMGGYILAPFVLADEFGYTATGIALVMLARPLAFGAGAPAAGYLTPRFGERLTGIAATASVAASMAVLAYGAATRSVPLVVVGLVLSGAGSGSARPPFTSSIANAVDESDLGIASATQNIVNQVGAAIGITVMTAVQAGSSDPGAFARAFWVGTGIATAALVFAAIVQDTDRAGAGSGDEGASDGDGTEAPGGVRAGAPAGAVSPAPPSR